MLTFLPNCVECSSICQYNYSIKTKEMEGRDIWTLNVIIVCMKGGKELAVVYRPNPICPLLRYGAWSRSKIQLLTQSQFTGASCQVRRNRTNLFPDTIIYYLLVGCHLLTSSACNVFSGCNWVRHLNKRYFHFPFLIQDWKVFFLNHELPVMTYKTGPFLDKWLLVLLFCTEKANKTCARAQVQ